MATLPKEPVLPEAAFIGRSNVGKSSLINMVCNRKVDFLCAGAMHGVCAPACLHVSTKEAYAPVGLRGWHVSRSFGGGHKVMGTPATGTFSTRNGVAGP